MTNEEIAQTIIEQSEATRSVPLTFLISRALLEADKNGYERGAKTHFKCQQWIQMAEHYAKEDEALLFIALEALEASNEKLVEYCDAQDSLEIFMKLLRAIKSLKDRLAPSDSGGEKVS